MIEYFDWSVGSKHTKFKTGYQVTEISIMDASPADWQEKEDEEEEEEAEEEVEKIKKRLVFDGLETPRKKQSVLVYLRIRPKSQREILGVDPDCLHQLSGRELQAVAPVTSQTYKNKLGTRCPSETSQIFSFTRIFDPLSSQKDVFEEAMLPTLKDFFGGQNCLVFTYGVTNSGKTYTVTGTPAEPGVLPRSLDVIFNSIHPQQLSPVLLRPKHFSEATYLTPEEAERECSRKEGLLHKAREGAGGPCGVEDTELTDSDMSTLSKASSNYSKVSDEGTSLDDILVHDSSSVELEDSSDVCYSVWVSFAEIYNEFIYDLLGEEPKNGRNRPSLRLAEDRNHNHFIKGLLEVHVTSVEEVMLLLKLGLRHRHVASTRLNYHSSRSHSIFTIKLIKMVNKEKPSKALVNRISIVDLAGAERSMKTGAAGMRVKEAGNINNSLLTLGKCIEAMRQNQTRRRGEEYVVPFRDSKLTRLFQNYFVGKGKGVRQGKITMVVNVSSTASVFDETVHVLKFSALTSKVVPIVKQVPEKLVATLPHPTPSHHPTFTAPTLITTPGPGQARPVEEDGEGEEDKTVEAKRTVSVLPASCEHCKLSEEQVLLLQGKVRALEVQLLECEYTIRQEVCREFQEQLIEIEESHRAELEEQAEDMQEMYEKRMHLLQKSMKKQYSRKRRRVEEEEEGEGEGEDMGKGKRRAMEAHLRERVSELEEELELERNRAAAELNDATETYESRVTRLNEQVNSLSLRLCEAGEAASREKRLQEELARVTAAHTSLESQLSEVRAEVEEREAQLSSSNDSLCKQLEMANSKILELTRESESLGGERSSLVLQYEERESLLRAEVASLREELRAATHTHSSLTSRVEEAERERAAVVAALSSAEEKGTDALAEVEILQARISELTWEKVSVESQLAEKQTSGDCQAQTLTSLEDKLKEVQSQLADRVAEVGALEQARSREVERTRLEGEEKLAALQEELVSVRKELSVSHQELASASRQHSKEVQGMLQSEREQLSATRDNLTSVQAKLAVKQELVYKLENEMEERSSQVSELQQQLMAKAGEIRTLWEKVEEKDELIGSLQLALREVQTTLESQTRKILSMDKDVEDVHSCNEALQERITSLERSLTKAQALKESLSTRVGELSAQLEDSRKNLAHREAELQDSSEQCRSILEQQLSEARAANSSLQLELAKARDEEKALQQQLREKESELLSLATSSSESKSALLSLSTEARELREALEKKESEHETQLEAVQGHHQLEVAQLTIRVRELAEREGTLLQAHEEEVEKWTEQVATLTKEADKKAVKVGALEQEVKTLKKTVKSLEGEKKASRKATIDLESQVAALEQQLDDLQKEQEREKQSERETEEEEEEHVYEEPPEVADEPTLYENDSQSISVLQPVENRLSTALSELDRSKPFVPVLERSSQIVEESFSLQEPRLVIDATPPIAKRRRGKKKKRSIEVVAREEEAGVTPETKRGKYQLRCRKKHQRFPEEMENTPVHKAPSLRSIFSKSSKKAASIANRSPSPAPTSLAGPATRKRAKRAIRKSQISGPLGLIDSPAPKRAVPHLRARVQLGLHL